MSFAPLDPILHNQLRLAVVSLLVGVESAEFNFILEKTGATRGNLSVQLTKLKDEAISRSPRATAGQLSLTTCKLHTGDQSLEGYVKAIQDY
ncbi:MAG: transcriptional regulator [Flavobacteriales bacterium]|nr:transcriptional regulator [Flavobacteriales bacterium]